MEPIMVQVHLEGGAKYSFPRECIEESNTLKAMLEDVSPDAPLVLDQLEEQVFLYTMEWAQRRREHPKDLSDEKSHLLTEWEELFMIKIGPDLWRLIEMVHYLDIFSLKTLLSKHEARKVATVCKNPEDLARYFHQEGMPVISDEEHDALVGQMPWLELVETVAERIHECSNKRAKH
jgi:hypothetical protein